MLQECHKLEWETDLPGFVADVRELMLRKKKESEARGDRAVYIHLLFRSLCRETARETRAAIAEAFPQAVVTGMSETLFGIGSQDPLLKINITCFGSSQVQLLEYLGGPEGYAGAGAELGEKLRGLEDVKAVAIYCSGISTDFHKFVSCLSEGNEEIPFFGATAGMFEYSADGEEFRNFFSCSFKNDAEQQYVVGEDMYRQGVVLAVFAGEDLQVRADNLFGWKPLGKEMTITAVRGTNCISSIDGIRPTEIYRRYLNVEPDENFVYNISEFPLGIERNGCLMARVPPRFDEEGRLYFSSDVYKGEKVRLTYGVHEDLLQGTDRASFAMWEFAPQAVYLTICGNRTVFLKDKAHVEVDCYRSFAKNLICNYGTSEIYRYQGQGGILNSALVAVGLREGEPQLSACACPHSKVKPHRIIPLSERMATFLDAVTRELRESNEEMKDMAEAAKAASRAKSQFLSNMSHEIRTPINAVLGMDEMILRETQEENIRQYAESIRTAGTALLGLINDILDFSKIEAGKMEIIPVEYASSSILNDLANMIRQRAEKKGLDFRVEVPEDLPSIMKGDEVRLRQVVTNILTNAVKYTEEGSVTLKLSWEKTGEREVELYIGVRDTGMGIKEEDIGKLFQAFQRVDEEKNRSIEGTGLGLNITQRLLELMGSRLEVVSRYGSGSVFFFKVRQEVMNWAPMGDYETAFRQHVSQQGQYQESFVAPEAKILVVDDTAMNLTVVQGLLKQTQVQIDTALSGFECLDRVKKTAYDLVLLDHRMPGLDGVETLKRMRALEEGRDYPNRGIPVIVLTANAVSGAREEYMAAGFDDYLTKPINSRHLEHTLQQYLPKEKVQAVEAEPEDEEKWELPEWLSKVPGLDTRAGVEHCGSVSAYLDALTVFARSIASGAQEIQQFYDTGEWKDYTTKVHALKSTARVIGALELSEKARRLEDAGNNCYCDEIMECTAPMLELYRSFLQSLSPLLPKEKEAEDKPPISPEELAEAWQAIGEIAGSFDYDSLSYMLGELDGYRLPDADREKLEKVKAAAAAPDWEKVREVLGM